MKFILPRLIGLTVIAGIGALLLSMVFKVLICATIVGAIVHLTARRFGRKHHAEGRQDMFEGGPFGRMQRAPFHPFGNNEVMPVYSQQRATGIIPIN